ncbi:vancomycin high temperature exclusion protein [Ruminobacter sp. RM87]|uniref:SanA/YdcF family protein n=1 Tax=Ruminobacter sp. RM87 TaxID=1200567 RepID=UPI00068B4945|nr:ElyC/SanA/YdcF family protein [Ruminobacter sp. RM87]
MSHNAFIREYGNFMRKVFYVFIITVLMMLVLTCIMMSDISRMSAYTYNSVEKIPHNRTGLLLGTSKFVSKNRINQYYQNRINAAIELFHSGKIDYIVVSGDNALQSYNEPRTMRKDLIKRGIPSDRIYLDYAGFRTLDSVVRIKHIFKQNSVTIISQDFHNERAVYIARHNGINAIAFNAHVPKQDFFVSNIREFFARLKCILDVYIFDSKPKFLGDSIEIGGENISPKHAQLHDTTHSAEGKPEAIIPEQNDAADGIMNNSDYEYEESVPNDEGSYQEPAGEQDASEQMPDASGTHH